MSREPGHAPMTRVCIFLLNTRWFWAASWIY